MNTCFVSDLSKRLGEEVELKGWAYNFRSSGKIFFLQLRDGSGRVQIVYGKPDVSEAVWEALSSLRIESSVIVRGKVKEDARSPSGVELTGVALEIVSLAAEDYPISKKEHGPDFLLEHRHLWLRSESQWAVLHVRDCIIRATYDHLRSRGFVKFDTPILTPTACEGTTELFEMDYFDMGKGEPSAVNTDGTKAYLAQSGQLYLEAGIMSLGRDLDFGPVFRAEKSKTRRHLTEFWMMDAEAAFVEHEGNMAIQEALICRIVQDVLKHCQYELKVLGRDTAPLEKVQAPFVHITHQEAVAKLRGMGSD